MDKEMPRLTSEEMAKLYEERAKEYREKAIVTRVSKGGREYLAKAKEAEAQAEYYRSKQFYAEHGHSEYAGKYAKPTIPEGYTVEEIREVVPRTPSGVKRPAHLEFTIKPPEKPKGIAQTILEYKLPGQAEWECIQHALGRAGYSEKPAATKMLARLITPFETAFYDVGSLVGGAKKTIETGQPQLAYGWEWAGLETPVIPATISGAVFSSEERKAVMAWTYEEKIAGLLGEIGLAWATGKIIEKTIIQPVSKAWRGSSLELQLIKHSERYAKRAAKGLAPQVVSYPAPKTVGMKSLEAQQLAWELSLTPRTSLVSVTKVGAKRTVYRFFRGVGYTPMAVTLAKAMSVKEMGGRQAILQIEKPAKGVMPYLPKIGTEVAPKIPSVLSTSLGVGLTLGVKAVPKPKRISKQKRKAIPISIPKLTLYEEPSEIMKEREKGVLLPKLRQPSISEVAVTSKAITVQKQIQQQVQIQISRPPPLKSIGKPPKLWRPRPRKTRRKRKKKGKLKGEWWLKTWPVKRSVFLPEEFELKMEL